MVFRRLPLHALRLLRETSSSARAFHPRSIRGKLTRLLSVNTTAFGRATRRALERSGVHFCLRAHRLSLQEGVALLVRRLLCEQGGAE